jgi:hypothetical protein
MPERNGRVATYETSIFLNCPFDHTYRPMFDALVFAAFDCGYVPRCALEIDDAGQVRIEKILTMVRGCGLGVHDISRTELDADCHAVIWRDLTHFWCKAWGPQADHAPETTA